MLTFSQSPDDDTPKPQLILSTASGRDREVGKVTPRQDRAGNLVWHAVLKLDDRRGRLMTHNTLAQGHGPTKEAAVRDAFTESREQALLYIKELSMLETELLGSDDRRAPVSSDNPADASEIKPIRLRGHQAVGSDNPAGASEVKRMFAGVGMDIEFGPRN